MSDQSFASRYQPIEDFAFQKITKEGRHSNSIQNPLSFLESCEMVEVTETASFDFPNFPEVRKNFQVIYFRLSPEFSAQKALVNGLISIGQPDGVILEFEKENAIYSLKFYDANVLKVSNYLHKIFRMVSEEIRFKSILRKVIINQQVFEKEEQLLKAELFA